MRRRLVLAVAATAVVCLSAAAHLLLPRDLQTVWRGYRILLVEDATDEPRVLERLHEAGFRDLISESLQPVQLSDYSSLVNIPLDATRQRLTEGDRRHDGYVAGLGRWFHADADGVGYRIYYLENAGSADPAARIAKALGKDCGLWMLPEGQGAGSRGFPIARLAVAVLAAVLLSLSFRRKRECLLAAAVSLPWIVLAPGSLQAMTAAAAWAPALCFSACRALGALDEFRLSGQARAAARVLLRDELASVPLLLPAIGLSLLDVSYTPCLALATAASALAFMAFSIGYREKRRGHPAFRAVSIGRARPEVLGFGQRLRLSYLVSVSVVVLGLATGLLGRVMDTAGTTEKQGSPVPSVRLPQPRPPAGKGIPSRPLPAQALILGASGTDELVNMADWLGHRWYQEAIFYLPLKERSLPPFSAVSIPLPSERDEVTRVFDDAWAREAYRTRPRGGVESLLLGEGSFVRCFYSPLAPGNRRPLAPMEVLLYIILLAPPSVGALSLMRSGFRDRRERSKTQ